MGFEEKKLSGKRVFSGKIFSVEVDEVSLPDGKTSVRECVRHHGGASVLFVNEGKIALVKQFRYLYGEEIYEIPAGKIEEGEDPALTALRELEEETGYKAEKVRLLHQIYPTPGYTDEKIYIYLCEKALPTKQKFDEGEFLSCVFLPIEEVVSLIDSGKIKDGKTIIAVYKYLLEKK